MVVVTIPGAPKSPSADFLVDYFPGNRNKEIHISNPCKFYAKGRIARFPIEDETGKCLQALHIRSLGCTSIITPMSSSYESLKKTKDIDLEKTVVIDEKSAKERGLLEKPYFAIEFVNGVIPIYMPGNSEAHAIISANDQCNVKKLDFEKTQVINKKTAKKHGLTRTYVFGEPSMR